MAIFARAQSPLSFFRIHSSDIAQAFSDTGGCHEYFATHWRLFDRYGSIMAGEVMLGYAKSLWGLPLPVGDVPSAGIPRGWF